MKITESRLREIIRNVINESLEDNRINQLRRASEKFPEYSLTVDIEADDLAQKIKNLFNTNTDGRDAEDYFDSHPLVNQAIRDGVDVDGANSKFIRLIDKSE